jgi:predicted acyltransferase
MSAAREPALDVFRGATVALMILVNNPGSWNALYPPLAHAPWHGVTPTDLVYPFFLFAVGHALALVMPALLAGPPGVFWARVARRTALIFAIGLLLNAAPFVRWDAAGELVLRDWSQLRIMGVLQRIALCFGAAAAIVWWAKRHTARPQRAVLAVVAVLLLGYQAMCVTLGAPGDPYSLQGWFGTAWDKALLGESHLYRGEGMPFDPEGLASTPPAVAQVLLGWWVGRTLACGAIDARAVARLFAAAVVLGVLAYAWQLGMPLNKKIWTSSYVLLTTSLAMATLAALIHLLNHGARLDGRPARATAGWVALCTWFGRNPLGLFVLAGLVPRFLGLIRWEAGTAADGSVRWTSPLPWVHEHVAVPLAALVSTDPRLGSLLFALLNLAFYAALAAWLHRRRLYWRV